MERGAGGLGSIFLPSVSGIATVPHLLLVGPGVPANSLAELLTLARREPAKYFYGSAGNGTFSHLLMELMKRSVGVEITHIPFKGVAPAPDTVPEMIGELWLAVYAPRGTAEGAIAKMREAISRTLATPEMVEFLHAQGAEVLSLPPKELAALTERDLQTWARVIKGAGIAVD